MIDFLHLAIESAGPSLSIALLSGTELRIRKSLPNPYGAPGLLLPLIEDALRETALTPQQLKAISVNIGPGSFTGLRAGIAAGQGMAFGLSCPLIGISAFQALAHGCLRAGGNFPVGVLLDSRRSDPFVASLQDDLSFIENPRFLPEDEIGEWKARQQYVLSDHEKYAVTPVLMDPYDIGLLALRPEFHLPAQPQYLRPPEISRPKSR